MNSNSFQSSNAKVFVTPGLSKSSRSNSIAIHGSFSPFIVDHIGCPIAMVVVIEIGSLLTCFLNVHFPYAGHVGLTLEQSLSMLECFLDDVRERLDYHGAKLRSQGLRTCKPIWILGSDLNCDMSGMNVRASSIRNVLAKVGVETLPPEIWPHIRSEMPRLVAASRITRWTGLAFPVMPSFA